MISWKYVSPEVFYASWWMGHYGAATSKRHIAWSNCKTIECLNMGVMAREVQQRLFRNAPKSARTYKTKDGRKGYAGTKFLKGTQNLVIPTGCEVFSLYYMFLFCSQTRNI